MEEQARIAYEKVLTISRPPGSSRSDVVQITENVTVAGLADYEAAAAVRREVFGEHQPAVTHRRRRAAGALAPPSWRSSCAPARAAARAARRQRGAPTPATGIASPIREGHDGTVYLPTMVPIDATGDVVPRATSPASTATAWSRPTSCCGRSGCRWTTRSPRTTTPPPRPATSTARRTRSARSCSAAPACTPGAGGILMSRLHHPEQLVAIDVTASRHPLELVNPGWTRYDTLTYSPGVKAGRTLFMSGFASLDMETQQALHPGDLAAQAEETYGTILHLLRYAGLGPAEPAGDHRVLRRAGAAGLPRRRRGAGAAAQPALAGLDRCDLQGAAAPGVPAGGLPDRAVPGGGRHDEACSPMSCAP